MNVPADLSTNPPKSPSGAKVAIQHQVLASICANLAGQSGALANVTGSFTKCMSYITNQSTLVADVKTQICNNLNPP